MKSDTKSDIKTDKNFFDPFSPLLEHGTDSIIFNEWRIETPGIPIIFANCNSKNASETVVYIHLFWAEAF